VRLIPSADEIAGRRVLRVALIRTLRTREREREHRIELATVQQANFGEVKKQKREREREKDRLTEPTDARISKHNVCATLCRLAVGDADCCAFLRYLIRCEPVLSLSLSLSLCLSEK